MHACMSVCLCVRTGSRDTINKQISKFLENSPSELGVMVLAKHQILERLRQEDDMLKTRVNQ